MMNEQHPSSSDASTEDQQRKKLKFDLDPKPAYFQFQRPIVHGLPESIKIQDSDYDFEKNVGMLKYICNEGFFGILKDRYSDFLVNEIDLDGNIAHLDDLTYTKPEAPPVPNKIDLIDDDTMKALLELQTAAETDFSQNRTLTIPSSNDKTQRKQIHEFIRGNFSNLDSETVSEGILVKFKAKNAKKIFGENRFLQFVLYKENRETLDCINAICKQLRIPNKAFSIAGTKDKRGITTQRITGFKVNAERLASMNSRNQGIRVGNFLYVKDALYLGDLKGNHFTIVIRNVLSNDDVINKTLTSFRTNGFVNYFGLQRFGVNPEKPTYHVGRCMLKKDWDQAVDLILNSREGDDATTAQTHWNETRDAEGALNLFPKKYTTERNLLKRLSQLGGAKFAANAINQLPRNLRSLYVHSYQSYIWNFLCTLRLEKYGFQPVIGDLVATSTGSERARKPTGASGSSSSSKDDAAEKEMKDDGEADPSNATGEEEAGEEQIGDVQYVTEENISNFTIHDVVLPVPGGRVLFPKHTITDSYTELMAKDEIDNSMFRQKEKEYSLRGAYRRIVSLPTNVDWKIVRYSNPHTELVETDLTRLMKLPPPTINEDGQYKGVILQLSLASSQYATMAIREITKLPTTPKFQTVVSKLSYEKASTPSTASSSGTIPATAAD